MKIRFIAGVLVIALGLSGCGSDEAVEAIATPSTTTAATFEMSITAATTVATTKSETTMTIPTTTAHPTTTTEETTTTYPPEEIYAIDFPKEFSCEIWSQPPYLKVPNELYDIEISEEAEKLYNDYFAFAEEHVNNKYNPHEEYPPAYMDGRFQHYPAGQTVYGLVDIDTDGVPEIFTFYTMGAIGQCDIDFYDLYSKEILSEKTIYGFHRDGLTYFGKNDKGNVMICSGYLHSIHNGFIEIYEMLYEKNADLEKLTAGDSFISGFEMTYGYLNCIGVNVNGIGKSERETGTYTPATDFEAAYREFYDAINFDVYWICGDILYHGPEETEYKGKMAYEKYLEFTTEKNLTSRSALLKPYELDINEIAEIEKDNPDFINIRKELSALDDDILTKIEKAYIIARGISFCNIAYTGNFNSNLDEDSGVYYYGISYESYFDYLKSVFTEDMIDKLFADYKLFVDINGELCKVGIGDRGSDPLYDYGVYSIKSSDSEKTEITLTAYRSEGDIVYQPSFYDIVLVKVDGEWKVDKFEYWI
jgi:hypothetical protein